MIDPSTLFRSQEQRQFFNHLTAHFEEGGSPLLLEGAAGLGKTRAYLSALLSCQKPVAICVPTRALAEQLLSSKDLASVRSHETVEFFSPKRFHDSSEDYEAHKMRCMNSDLLICTHQAALIDLLSDGGLFSLSDRFAILFDEADQMPEAASLRMDFSISAQTFASLNIKVAPTHFLPSLNLMRTALASDASTSLFFDALPQIKASCAALIKACETPSWSKQIFLSSNGSLQLRHRLPGKLFSSLYSHPRLAFVSATLGLGAGNPVEKFKAFSKSMGFKKISPLSHSIEPKRHGELVVVHEAFDVQESFHLNRVAEHIKALDGFVLVAMNSKADAEALHHLLPDISTIREPTNDGDSVFYETAQNAAARLNQCVRVLIAFSVWSGLDTSVRWSHVVMPRAPYTPPLEGLDNSHYSYVHSTQMAIRRFKQCLSRGLRQTDSYCHLHLLDARFQRALFQHAIPERFSDQRGYSAKFSLVERRQSQTMVRSNILSRYEHRCAISGEENLTVLQAAHWGVGGWRKKHDGICLRSDLHLLYDRNELLIERDEQMKTALISLVGDLADPKWKNYIQFHKKIIELK